MTFHTDLRSHGNIGLGATFQEGLNGVKSDSGSVSISEANSWSGVASANRPHMLLPHTGS